MDDAEYRVGAKGQVFEAAPKRASKTLEPQVVKGSTPRDWETRRFGECAAVVTTLRDGGGHPRHLACCLPIEVDRQPPKRAPYPYCPHHWPFVPPKATGKAYVKGLRRYITG